MRWLLLPYRVMSRFFAERCAQTAAALSFATLLGLVPMIALAVAVLAKLPLADSLMAAMEKFLLSNLLPERAGTIIAKYVTTFAHKAGRLTVIGVVGLAVTALAQMLTIEHAFNAIWGVREHRPFLKRIAMHSLALLLGPLVFGVAIAATTYLASASLGLVDEWHWVTTPVLRAVSFSFVVSIFGLLYWKVPNRYVPWWHAALGGLFSAATFSLMQSLFADYVAGVSSYRVMYGAFSAIPIFLLWLYLSWSVILLGALLTAEMGSGAAQRRRR